MAEASDIHGTVLKNGSVTLLARVVDAGAQALVIGDVSAAEYSVYLLDDDDVNVRTAVTGHADVSLTVGDLIHDSLQIDDLWTVDAVGYNFRHVLDVSANQAFTIAGRRYLIEFQLTPASGQVILVRFRVNVI